MNKRGCSFNATFAEGSGYSLVANPSKLRPFFGVVGFAVARQDDASSLIAKLLRAQSPANIVLAVSEVVVNPLNRVRGCWGHTNIRNKVIKRTEPPFTDRNSARAIVFKERVVGVAAALLHGRPPFIEGVAGLRIFDSSAHCSSSAGFSPQTAARQNSSVDDVGGRNCFLIAAITLAQITRPKFLSGFFQQDKPPETLASQVNLLWHGLVQSVKLKQIITKNKSQNKFTALWKGHANHANTKNLFNAMEI
jgi:hypothetical protein